MGNWIPLLIVVAVICFLYFRKQKGVAPPLYTDDGIGSRVFVHREFGISAKPDLVEGTAENATLVEFKRRSSKVYESDRMQVVASVLALRDEGINVSEAFVEIGNGKRVSVDIDGSDDDLLSVIKVPLEQARLVEAGGTPTPLPAPYKCPSCGYRRQCPHAMSGNR